MTAILEKLTLYWAYPFVRYALIVGVLIALCSSLLGVTLVLKRFSFIGDGLSHVAFGAMAIAAVLQITNKMPLVMVVTILSAVLLLRTGQNTKIHLVQSFGRCVQHAVRLHLHSDAVPRRGLAVRWNVGAGRGGVHSVLQ